MPFIEAETSRRLELRGGDETFVGPTQRSRRSDGAILDRWVYGAETGHKQLEVLTRHERDWTG